MWEYNTAYLGAANDAQILALFRKWAEAVRWLRRPGLAEVSVTWNLLPARRQSGRIRGRCRARGRSHSCDAAMTGFQLTDRGPPLAHVHRLFFFCLRTEPLAALSDSVRSEKGDGM